MKLRTFFLFFFFVLTVFAGANVALGVLLGKADDARIQSERQKDKITSLSEDLVISSQFATRFARGYVATRDPRRLRWHNEVVGILEGAIARPEGYGVEYWDLVSGGLLPEPDSSVKGLSLENQFLQLNLTVEEFNLLKKAEELLLKLATSERIAMHAINGEFDDGTGAFSKRGKPDPALADRLLYSENYVKQNADLAKLVYDFTEKVKGRYETILRAQEDYATLLVRLNIYLATGLFATILLYLLLMRSRFMVRMRKLMDAVTEISAGKLDTEIGLSGRDEIAELAEAVGSMAGNLSKAFEKLEERALVSERTAVELDNERLRSEKLLHNILPATIAQRLQGGEAVIAEVYPEVTVFFSDIVGFTDLSAKLGPHETVNLLNMLFEKFDELVEKHGVEKIKTIGDSYMVVGGVPNRDPLHCQHVAEFALEAIGFVRAFSDTYPFPIQMRMGIHTGTVAAGVLGRKKFSYDLWGDVVNVASRFESTSLTDRIHVSESVRVRLSDDFIFQDAGTVDLKGKGVTASYYLLGKKKELAGVVEFRKQQAATAREADGGK
ncbi:adenylate/guanylate cyclase domain-containing protein [Methylocystis sp. IM3]|uniref:adenylate/guanylate cyclase domain-containing protein n=1 Tax=unclassified Methylocystis TaxID=2625913 RepID=UPI003119CC2E